MIGFCILLVNCLGFMLLFLIKVFCSLFQMFCCWLQVLFNVVSIYTLLGVRLVIPFFFTISICFQATMSADQNLPSSVHGSPYGHDSPVDIDSHNPPLSPTLEAPSIPPPPGQQSQPAYLTYADFVQYGMRA